MRLQDSVREWHLEVFPDASAEMIADKVIEEAHELRFACGDSAVSEECADVYLTVLALAGRAGFDLEEAARAKFAINQERARNGRWAVGKNQDH